MNEEDEEPPPPKLESSRKTVKILDDAEEDTEKQIKEDKTEIIKEDKPEIKKQDKPEIKKEDNSFRNIYLASRTLKKRNSEPKDHYDVVSMDPSYTDFEIPYGVKCKMRYAKKSREYDKQFKKEMHNLEIFQQTAYEAARFSRHLGMTTLWPPLHNRREIDKFVQKFFVHTPKDRTRLIHLLTETQT